MANYHVYSPSNKVSEHPTEKPVRPLGDLIKVFPDLGDLVLDPLCGSGSALKAAQRAGREWIGIENNPEHAKMSEKRLNVGIRKLDEFRGRGNRPLESDKKGRDEQPTS